ncbi:hypothetical protein PT974_12475 [Cladobotryum mycophilum]|uniref:Uncharacterized protein n=1 Tax=Cladobotryum mycophilum TaxID=491253 RepID=A0ABR0S975_9HYPO
MVYSAKVMKAARAVIQSRDNISHRSRRPGTVVPVALSIKKSAEKYREESVNKPLNLPKKKLKLNITVIFRNPLLQEAIQEASRAPRLLLAFNFPPSDASVNIITAREDEDKEEYSDSLFGLNSYEEYKDLELQDNTFEETQFESIFDAADEQRLPSLPPALLPPSSPPATPLSTPCRIVKSFKMHITDNLRTPRSNSIYNTYKGAEKKKK